jgi:transcriptional regulator with XRE-family HTH domain
MTDHPIKKGSKKAEKHEVDNGLGAKIRSLLKEHSLRINKLAELLDLPVMTIRRLISGETQDPRLSTLKLIANHFNVSLDALTDEHIGTLKTLKTTSVPLLSWEAVQEAKSLKNIDLTSWKEWQSLPAGQERIVGSQAFGLPSRPAMYSRFPKGTIFIIDPEVTPTDGDIVLVKIKQDHEITLRTLFIDPPNSELQSITSTANSISYSKKDHTIIGVNVLTLLYNRKGKAKG